MKFLCVLSTLEVSRIQIISPVIELESTSWVLKNMKFERDEKSNFD